MPPTPVQNTWIFLGAAVVGLVSAAGVFIIEHYRHERRRHAMAQDLARLDRQVSGMRKELEQLQALQKDKATKVKRVKKATPKSNSSGMTNTTDGYSTANDIDSSDMEFYDLSEDEDFETSNLPLVENHQVNLETKFKEIDQLLDLGEESTCTDAFEQLTDLNDEIPNNAEIHWRFGKCYHKLSKRTSDIKRKEELINKGIKICSRALELDDDLAECHKWFAILIGSRGEFQPIKNRIQDGHTFKKHVDIAIQLKPGDATLHHMLGRFAFEVASLKWYERKAASALFSEPPSATYEDALKHLLESEQLTTDSWKENKLILAKCYLHMGNVKEGLYWLDKADALETTEDETIDAEIKRLKEKYNGQR